MNMNTGIDGQGGDVGAGERFGQSHDSQIQGQTADTRSGTGVDQNTGTGSPAGVGNEYEVVGPHTFNSQTWVDFLRDAHIPPSLQSRENPLPPLPTESRSHSGPYAQDQHPHYSEPLGAYSAYPYSYPSSSANIPPPLPPKVRRDSNDKKRRLTTGESPHRRGSGIQASSSANVHADEGLIMDPRMFDSSSRGTSTPFESSASYPAPNPTKPPPHGSQGSGLPTHFEPSASYPTLSPPVPAPRASQGSSSRRETDIVLPPWQPDRKVSHCFVCGSQFTFFYRKHHCRKCGRVVCAACSPHRITIPRQFIVHPPNENANIIDLTGDDEENPLSAYGPFRNPALGGGEVVRVCNPCVPDPNYSPPPPYTPMPAPSPYTPQFSSQAPHPAQSHPQLRGGHRPSQSLNHGSQTVAGHAYTSRDPFSDGRTSYHDSTRVSDLWPPQSHQQQQHYPYNPYSHSQSRPQPISSSTMPASIQSNNRHSMGPSMFRHNLISGINPPIPPPRPHKQLEQRAHPPPRQQIAEEDECPICGNELPPKGPDGDESERTNHVEECIVLHSSSATPAPSTPTPTPISTSLPSQRTRGMSSAAGNPTATEYAGNGEGTSSDALRNRNRMSMNMSARGMVVFTATEKDCVDDQGEEAECVICFEEVVVGAKLARLVCFCKFHETCIRGWWDMKGRGACPTHQLHD